MYCLLDIVLVIQYFSVNLMNGVYISSTFIMIASLSANFFSFKWFYDDNEGSLPTHIWSLHLLQLGIVFCYVCTLKSALNYNQNNNQNDFESNNYYRHQSAVSILRLFQSFMHSSPQFVLQMHIYLTENQWSYWTFISMISSIVSISWGIASYNRDMRNSRSDKKKLSFFGIIFLTLWKIGSLSSRMIALVLFSSVAPKSIFIIMSTHWLLMFLWIRYQKTDFCVTKWEECLYNAVIAIIYCFCFLNLKEGKSRYRAFIFYNIMFVENVIFLSIYLYLSVYSDESLLIFNSKYSVYLVLATIICFIIGIISMILFYRFFHPSGPIHLNSTQSNDSLTKSQINKTINNKIDKSLNLNFP